MNKPMSMARTATPPAAPPATAATFVLLWLVTTTVGALVGVVKALVMETELIKELADVELPDTKLLEVDEADVLAADEGAPVGEYAAI